MSLQWTTRVKPRELFWAGTGAGAGAGAGPGTGPWTKAQAENSRARSTGRHTVWQQPFSQCNSTILLYLFMPGQESKGQECVRVRGSLCKSVLPVLGPVGMATQLRRWCTTTKGQDRDMCIWIALMCQEVCESPGLRLEPTSDLQRRLPPTSGPANQTGHPSLVYATLMWKSIASSSHK